MVSPRSVSGPQGTTRRRPARRPRRGRPSPRARGSTKSRSTGTSNHRSWWRTSAPACMRERQPPAGGERPRERAEGVGELGGGQVDERVPREHRRPPAAVGRPHQPAQVADLVGAVREPAPGLLDHPRRQVDARRVRAGAREVGRDVPRPAADLDHRPAVGVRGDPVEQPALERQAASARRRARRRTPPPPRRTTTAPARRAPRPPSARTASRSTAGGPRRRLSGASAEQVQPPVVLLAGRAAAAGGPGLRARPSGAARPRPHRGRRRRAAARCGVRSSPGACGPRSSRTVTSACSSSAARAARRASGGTSASGARCRPTRSGPGRAP